MDRRQIAALLVLKHLGVKQDLDSFDRRLIVQKAIYLTQAAGIDLGYYYSWYLRGPYCSPVAQDLFSALDDRDGVNRTLPTWTLDPDTTSRLGKLKSMLQPEGSAKTGRSTDTTAQAQWLELLASVHFLIDRKQVQGHGAKEISARLAKFQKDYDEEEVQKALDTLRRQKLLKAARR